MKIAIIGGTGGLGGGLALRWAMVGHKIVIGSREAGKAINTAEEYKKILEEIDLYKPILNVIDWISGLENSEAVKGTDVVVISVPHKHVESTIETINPFLTENQIIISVVVPMEKEGKFFRYTPPKEGSAAMQIKNLLPGMKVVAAFQNVSAKKLSDLEKELDTDVLVCGDDNEAAKIVCGLVKDIPNLNPKLAGPIEISAATVEANTPLLINVATLGREKDLGIKCC